MYAGGDSPEDTVTAARDSHLCAAPLDSDDAKLRNGCTDSTDWATNLPRRHAKAARMEAAAAREKEVEERGARKAREAAKARGLAMPEDFNDGPPTAQDRVLSALPYVLPLMDSLAYGAHVFNTFPDQVHADGCSGLV